MENPELRPRISLKEAGSYLLALVLGVFTILVLGAALFGCAAVNGQEKIAYTGKVAFHSYVAQPDAPRGFGVASGPQLVSYWDRHTYGIFTVANGTNEAQHMLLDCGMYEPTVDVPPLTSQQILVDTTPAHMDSDLCVQR
jgi:hypothetical protein